MIKIGVFGTGRGMSIAKNFMLLGCEIVALCDFHKERMEKAAAQLDKSVAIYEDFDAFLQHDMDAVILANYFHEHAPFAIKCFERNLHVYSECISNGTMAEGVALIRAFEKSSSIYMLAENYPQMLTNRELKRLCDSGTLGKILYAEGEYNHPVGAMDIAFKKQYTYFPSHWRNFLPRTYYITHSLGPVMWATGATPQKVTAMAAFAPNCEDVPEASHVGDRAAVIMTQNDDGSIFRVTGCAAFGGHHNAYRICGTEGQIENLRGMGNQVMLRYNAWSKPADAQEINLYTPKWNDQDEALIKDSGHGGSDFLTARMFVECIRNGTQPEHPFHIHAAVNMSSVAILSHRSMLEGGVPYEIPDFHQEAARVQYENDWLSPIPTTWNPEPTQPCCSHPDHKPTQKQMALYKEALDIKD